MLAGLYRQTMLTRRYEQGGLYLTGRTMTIMDFLVAGSEQWRHTRSRVVHGSQTMPFAGSFVWQRTIQGLTTCAIHIQFEHQCHH